MVSANITMNKMAPAAIHLAEVLLSAKVKTGCGRVVTSVAVKITEHMITVVY